MFMIKRRECIGAFSYHEKMAVIDIRSMTVFFIIKIGKQFVKKCTLHRK